MYGCMYFLTVLVRVDVMVMSLFLPSETYGTNEAIPTYN